jgi:hypothetical protein
MEKQKTNSAEQRADWLDWKNFNISITKLCNYYSTTSAPYIEDTYQATSRGIFVARQTSRHSGICLQNRQIARDTGIRSAAKKHMKQAVVYTRRPTPRHEQSSRPFERTPGCMYAGDFAYLLDENFSLILPKKERLFFFLSAATLSGVAVVGGAVSFLGASAVDFSGIVLD